MLTFFDEEVLPPCPWAGAVDSGVCCHCWWCFCVFVFEAGDVLCGAPEGEAQTEMWRWRCNQF